MIFYFTATGNSLYAAKQLDEKVFSIPQVLREAGLRGEDMAAGRAAGTAPRGASAGSNTGDMPAGRAAATASSAAGASPRGASAGDRLHFKDNVIGIVYPNFGGNQPKVVQDFLRSATFETDYFFMIATYGFRAGASADNADAICRECGIRLDYFRALFMVDNYLPNFDIANELKMDKNEDGQIAEIAADIRARKHEVILSTPEEIEARRQHLIERRAKLAAARNGAPASDTSCGKLFSITDDCIGCGTCVRVCPEGDYYVQDERAHHDGGYCLGCLACVHNCPQKAIKLTIPEKNPDARYRNPHVSLKEIIAANCQF